MKKILFNVSLTIVSIIATFTFRNSVFGNDFKIVIDLDDKKIEVPVNPKRIASFHGPTYDRILMLGKADCIAMMPLKATPWAYKLYPEIKNLPIGQLAMIPDVERLLRLKVDFVFYAPGHTNPEKIEAAGIKTACPFSEKKPPETLKGFIQNFKRQIIFYSDIFGPESAITAEKYCKYFDNIIFKIYSVTSRIPDKMKPDIYYCSRANLLSTQGKNTIMQWYTEIAGGNFLTKYLQTYFADVNMEQVISWNPDIILVGFQGSKEAIKENPGWDSIKAVKKQKVYEIPKGIFWWDLAGGDSIMLPMYMAKKFHPELFKDLNLIEEMKKFYSEIYHKRISSGDAGRILDSLPPI
jgi:iron complex transport system substrate-binding protein